MMPRMSERKIQPSLRLVGTATFLSVVGATGLIARVQALPSNSPSARMAARLKYSPPAGWIRHYLGDDRYKIAGGVWRVVSTQMDTYYHRANCPNMMKQPSNIVIGFPNGIQAVEAGYRPDPVCKPEEPAVEYDNPTNGPATAPGLPGGPGGGGPVTVNTDRTPRRITLADGVSTVLLPPNWRRVGGLSRDFPTPQGSMSITMDMLQPQGVRDKGIAFLTMTFPGQRNIEQLLQPDSLRNFARLGGGGMVSNAGPGVDDFVIRKGRLGGLPGVLLIPRASARLRSGQLSPPIVAAARGNKLFLMNANVPKAPGVSIVTNSFKPR